MGVIFLTLLKWAVQTVGSLVAFILLLANPAAGVLAFIMVFVLSFALGESLKDRPEQKTERETERKPKNFIGTDESDAEFTDNEYYTRIAGVRHHCKFRDVGGFLGYAVPDPDNPHDRDAVAILRADDNKLLGFIPAVGLRDYKKWSRGRALPCVGYIREGQMLFGKVKVIDDDPEGTLEAIVAFVTWMLRTFGVGYKPDAITLDGDEKLTTAEEWIDALRQALKDGSIRTMDAGGREKL